MSFPDETLYSRNDDDMEDYGDIGAYDDSVEEEYEEEEEEEMGEPAALTPRGGALTPVARGTVTPSISKAARALPHQAAPTKKAAKRKKKGGKKKPRKSTRRGHKKPAKKRGKKKAAKKKKGGRRR
jgi:hypothetical protein